MDNTIISTTSAKGFETHVILDTAQEFLSNPQRGQDHLDSQGSRKKILLQSGQLRTYASSEISATLFELRQFGQWVYSDSS